MASDRLRALIDHFRTRPLNLADGEHVNRPKYDRFAGLFAPAAGVAIGAAELGGVPAERHVAGDGPCVLYLHGGGYTLGSPVSHRHLVSRLAAELGGEVWAIHYRLAPEAPFPAAVEDAAAAWEALTRGRPEGSVAIMGDSAGGGLAFATAIVARDRGLAAPSALAAASPWVDMTASSSSYEFLAGVDPIIQRADIVWHARRYLGDADPLNGLASPLFARLDGLPPTLIQVGDREVLFGDAVRMHQRLIAAGVDSELAVWKEMFHVWHFYWPQLEEGAAAIVHAADFIRRRRDG
ncbi:alpha/beta hydrolase [Camelimonas abortus]|uniref:Alpha/beta hydrolase n=1 Tax=Camelimonas abortus TaxID=1017184 RepID=A0ABV7LHF4_9HYPH